MYHAWKARNKKQRTAVQVEENQRVPQAVLEAASKPSLKPRASLVPSDAQRYFRIPFVKPSDASGAAAASADAKKGHWYASTGTNWT